MPIRFHKIGPPFAVLAVLTSAMGCAPTTASLSKTLAFASFEFNDGVRWRKYQVASRRLSPVIRDTYMDHAEQTDDKINVSEINLLRTKIDIKRKAAVLRFRYIWHRTNRGIVRKTVVEEHWKQTNNVWFVMKILNASGQAFPLFVGLTPEAQKEKKKRKKSRPQPKRPRPKDPAGR
jgi:hypothetical protein